MVFQKSPYPVHTTGLDTPSSTPNTDMYSSYLTGIFDVVYTNYSSNKNSHPRAI